MSGIHTTYGAHDARAHHGPRYSASDRPLPPLEARTPSGARTRLSVAIIAVDVLMALGILAPTPTLGMLLAVVATGAVLWGAFDLADRKARSWGDAARRASHRASSHSP